MPRLRTIRRVGLAIATLILVLALGVGVYGYGLVRSSFPQTSGTISVPGLGAKVQIRRDAQGVPSIYADNAADLFRAQGYVHAQDRFFEMDLRRHVTAGRLAELVGADGIESDRVIRTMGWRRVAEQELSRLSPEARQYLQAYADGVNAYLNDKSVGDVALEYVILGQRLPDYRIEEWSPVDSIAWLKAMAWDLRSDYTDELTRARLAGRVSADQLRDLYPSYPVTQHPPILSPNDWTPASPASAPGRAGTAGPPRHSPLTSVAADRAYASTTAALAAIPDLLGRGADVGSNAWVVSGSRSSTGKPLLANDTHLATSMPGIWYQASLHCTTISEQCPFDVSGYTFAGVPGVVIGHNARIAWGFSNLAPDVTDFYLEQIDESNASYLRDGSQVPLAIRTETIEVAGGRPEQLTIRETVHGPVLSDVLPAVREAGDNAPVDGRVDQTAYAVSLAWTALRPNKTVDAVLALNKARNFTEFRAAARNFDVPAQNMLYADVDGHIGYQAPGMVPIRRTDSSDSPPGFWPAKGWESQWDWTGMVPFEEMPWALDPPEGFLVAANQAVTSAATPFLTSQWDPGFRSSRIRDLLLTHDRITPQQMLDMQADTRNQFAPTLVASLLKVKIDDPFITAAQDLLRDWDFTNPIGRSTASSAAAYYNAVWTNIVALTFNDELPTDLQSPGGAAAMESVSVLLSKPKSLWWDDRQTPGLVETRDEILRQALVDARLELTRRLGREPSDWQWGRLHHVTFEHQVLGGPTMPAVVRWLVNSDTYEVPGGSSLINAIGFDASKVEAAEGYDARRGPAMRMLVDLGNLDESRWVNQTGQSGHPRNDHYGDQIDAWRKNKTFPWPFTQDASVKATKDTLTLTPGPTS